MQVAPHQTQLEVHHLLGVTSRIAHIQVQSLRLERETTWKMRIPRNRALKTPLMRHPRQTETARNRKRTTRVPESPKGQPRNLSLATFQKKPFLRSHLVMAILQRVQSPLRRLNQQRPQSHRQSLLRKNPRRQILLQRLFPQNLVQVRMTLQQ